LCAPVPTLDRRRRHHAARFLHRSRPRSRCARARLPHGLEVHELEQLEVVQLPLCLLDEAPTVELARLEQELAANDLVAHRLVADDVRLAEIRLEAGDRLEDDLGFPRVGAGALVDLDACARKALVPQRVHRQLVRRQHVGLVERSGGFDRGPVLERFQLPLREGVEAVKGDRSHQHRLTFRHVHGEVDAGSIAGRSNVGGRHAGIREPAVQVKRVDTLEVGLKALPIEGAFPAPRPAAAHACRESVPQLRGIDVLDARERQAVDGELVLVPGAVGPGRQRRAAKQQEQAPTGQPAVSHRSLPSQFQPQNVPDRALRQLPAASRSASAPARERTSGLPSCWRHSVISAATRTDGPLCGAESLPAGRWLWV